MAEGRTVKKLQEFLLRIFHYLSARLTEPSSWKGITLIMAAGGWNKLDSSNKGEVIMQLGLIAFGLLQVLLPQSIQYRTEK